MELGTLSIKNKKHLLKENTFLSGRITLISNRQQILRTKHLKKSLFNATFHILTAHRNACKHLEVFIYMQKYSIMRSLNKSVTKFLFLKNSKLKKKYSSVRIHNFKQVKIN